MNKKISRIIGLVMVVIAIVFVVFALNHPEMSFPWNLSLFTNIAVYRDTKSYKSDYGCYQVAVINRIKCHGCYHYRNT